MPDFIDRAELFKKAKEQFLDVCEISPDRRLGFLDCVNVIRSIPQADTERHAHWGIWDEDTNTYECSNCKNLFTLLEGTPEQNTYFYCPYCGYKMNKINND